MKTYAPASLEDIKLGLERREFLFHYQPKVSFSSGKITGAEALIRWCKPDGKIIPPSLFIPVAEASGFIRDITQQMFPRLVEDWQQIMPVDPASHVAFNISASDLECDDLLFAIEDAIDRGSIKAASLRLEVTEAAALGGGASTMAWGQRLVSRGIQLAMDDFGTGYATLDAIRKLPFSTLKIDQSVVREMPTSERATMLVQANVSLAQVLSMDTVAEGIETESIYNALLHSGCREGQGYWMSRPLPLSEYLTLLRSGRTWPASHTGLLRAVLMSHVVELRRVMDWVYSANRAGTEALPTLRPYKEHRRRAFTAWYAQEADALREHRTFAALQQPSAILDETYEVIQRRVAEGAAPVEITQHLSKLAHYSVVVIGDLLRLESELLHDELEQKKT
jgi:EAL domain-containing protein (putative c-di-GMP-specific phosphodiesterase class I)